MAKRLEILTNVALLGASIVMCTALALQYRDRHRALVGNPTTSAYKTGEHLEMINGVDYGASNGTLFLFVRSSCHFCTESMPFYHDLVDAMRAARNETRVVGLCPEELASCQKYLADHRVAVDQVIAVSGSELPRLRATPTLILVNRKGSIEALWKGRLSAAGEQEVRKRFLSASSARSIS